MPQIPRFFLPILLTEHWDASKTLPLIPSSTPILMLSGKQDALVPQTQMITLRNLRGDGRCTWRELNGEHNDTCLTPEYWAEVKDWLTNEVGVDAVRTSGGSTDTEGIVEKDN
jgi:predicted esterase